MREQMGIDSPNHGPLLASMLVDGPLPSTLTQPRLIAEWWIPAAGGISVTNDGRTAESKTFSLEQLIAWDPDILIVTEPKEPPTSTGLTQR